MTFDILNVIQLGSKRVVNVNDDDLPVGLTLVEEGHDAENLDLFDLTGVTDLFTDLANIKGIVVTLGLGFRVRVTGVFPSLEKGYQLKKSNMGDVRDLRKCTIVPNVTVVGEAVTNKTQTVLLDVLLDGIQRFLFGGLELGVSPTGDLDNHVEDAIALIGKERNVMEGGYDVSVAFKIDTMFWWGW